MNSQNGYWKLSIAKDYMKFAAAHMTVFPDGTKERLHGHNYHVRFAFYLSDASFSKMINFVDLKNILKPILAKLDEKILLANNNPHCSIQVVDGSLQLTACSKKYSFPSDEVVVLPIDNLTTEALAQEIHTQYVAAVKSSALVTEKALSIIHAIEIDVTESNGQGATYFKDFV